MKGGSKRKTKKHKKTRKTRKTIKYNKKGGNSNYETIKSAIQEINDYLFNSRAYISNLTEVQKSDIVSQLRYLESQLKYYLQSEPANGTYVQVIPEGKANEGTYIEVGNGTNPKLEKNNHYEKVNNAGYESANSFNPKTQRRNPLYNLPGKSSSSGVYEAAETYGSNSEEPIYDDPNKVNLKNSRPTSTNA